MLCGHLAEVVLPQPGGPSNRMALGQLLAYFLRVLRAMPSNTCSQENGSQDLKAYNHVSCQELHLAARQMLSCYLRRLAAMTSQQKCQLACSMQLQGQEA